MSRFGFFNKGEITAFLKQRGITPLISESLTIDVMQSIKISIWLNTNCVGKGSRQQDLHGDDNMIALTSCEDSLIKDDIDSYVLIVSSNDELITRTLLASRSERILEILEMKKLLNNSGIFEIETLFGNMHCFPLPYILETY